MSSRREIAIATFGRGVEARAAVKALRDAGFSEDEIGVIGRDEEGEPSVKSFGDLEGNQAEEGVKVGAAAGVGGGALWAIGVAAGVLPAIGPVIAGGLLAAVFASAAGGGIAGGVVGALVGLGVDDEEAAYYARELRHGRTVVVVDLERRPGTAVDILRRYGGDQRTSSGQHISP